MALQRGRIVSKTPEVSGIRSLARADLSLLTEKRPVKTLQATRDSHHRIARALASGLSNRETAELCGISENRVGVMKSDPLMIELVAHYRALLTEGWATTADPVTEYLRSNALKAQKQISDQLDEAEDKGETLPMRNLLAIAELGLDRTGYGKVNKNLNVNVDFAAQLEGARRRASSARIGSPPSAQLAPAHRAPAPSIPGQGPAAFRRI